MVENFEIKSNIEGSIEKYVFLNIILKNVTIFGRNQESLLIWIIPTTL